MARATLSSPATSRPKTTTRSSPFCSWGTAPRLYARSASIPASSARAAASLPVSASASATTRRFSVSADGAGVSSSSSNMLPASVMVAVGLAVVGRVDSAGGATGTSTEVTPVVSSSTTTGGGG